jgi:hypothetical protein
LQRHCSASVDAAARSIFRDLRGGGGKHFAGLAWFSLQRKFRRECLATLRTKSRIMKCSAPKKRSSDFALQKEPRSSRIYSQRISFPTIDVSILRQMYFSLRPKNSSADKELS